MKSYMQNESRVIPYEGGTLWHPTSPISLYYGYIKSGNELGGNPEWFCDISNGSRENLCWAGGGRGDLHRRENRISDPSDHIYAYIRSKFRMR